MATPMVTPAQRLAILKHLVDGRTPEWVAQAESLSVADVLHVAASHGYPDPAKMAWAVDVVAANLADSPRPTTPAPGGRAAPARPEPPSEVARLLARAAKSPAKATRAAGERVVRDVQALRDRLALEDARERAKVEKERAAAQAQAERERLAQEAAAQKEAVRQKIRALEDEIAQLRRRSRVDVGRASAERGITAQQTGVAARVVRAWAVEHGLLDTGTHGRMPNDVWRAYLDAHPKAGASS